MTLTEPAPTRPKIPAATWVAIVTLGLSGQIAWNVENNWFNTFPSPRTRDPSRR